MSDGARIAVVFSIHKVVWPSDADKIANSTQHPKSLETDVLK